MFRRDYGLYHNRDESDITDAVGDIILDRKRKRSIAWKAKGFIVVLTLIVLIVIISINILN